MNESLRDTFLMFQRDHDRCSVDRMLCRPSLRNAFLAAARLSTRTEDEEPLLWGVVNLRKKKALPKTH
jgi:hypothetical protein